MLDNIVDSTMASFSEGLTGAGDQGVAQLGQDFYDQLAQKPARGSAHAASASRSSTGKSTVRGTCVLANDVRLLWSSAGFAARADRPRVHGPLRCPLRRGPGRIRAAGVERSGRHLHCRPAQSPLGRLVPIITPDEAAELTYYGSEVIHPFTMEQVIRARIPIRIKNVENPQGRAPSFTRRELPAKVSTARRTPRPPTWIPLFRAKKPRKKR